MCYCLSEICYNKKVDRLLPLICVTSMLCASAKRWADMAMLKLRSFDHPLTLTHLQFIRMITYVKLMHVNMHAVAMYSH